MSAAKIPCPWCNPHGNAPSGTTCHRCNGSTFIARLLPCDALYVARNAEKTRP